MGSRQNYATVKEVQSIKNQMFAMEQRINANLAKVDQLKAAFAANIERIAEKIVQCNAVASQVDATLDVCEQAGGGTLPKRLESIDAPALIESLKI
jgi:hypothetical protein